MKSTALSTLLLWTLQAAAGAPAPPRPDLGVRAAWSDVVVLGEITRLEAKPLGKSLVAVVKVLDPILMREGLTHLRVADLIAKRTVRYPKKQIMFLKRHPKHPVYVPSIPVWSRYPIAINKSNLVKIKSLVELMNDPSRNLQHKEAEKRAQTAMMLLYRYRTRKAVTQPERPIDAKESQLILEALLDANWKSPGGLWKLSPLSTFYLLGLKGKDGWTEPPFRGREAAMKRWLKSNAGKYRIQKYVNP